MKKRVAKKSRVDGWRQNRLVDFVFAFVVDFFCLKAIPTRLASDLIVGGVIGSVLGFVPFYLARRKGRDKASFWFLVLPIVIGACVSSLFVTVGVSMALFAMAFVMEDATVRVSSCPQVFRAE